MCVCVCVVVENTPRKRSGFVKVRAAGRRLGLPAGALATAGVKDRRAVTRQFLTVDLGKSRDATACRVLARVVSEGGGLRIDDATLWPLCVTERALNAGRLRGNAFRLRVFSDNARDECLKRFAAAPRCLNVFGPQRVGRDDGEERGASFTRRLHTSTQLASIFAVQPQLRYARSSTQLADLQCFERVRRAVEEWRCAA